MKKTFQIVLMLLIAVNLFAQEKEDEEKKKNLIQVYGMVVSGDSLAPVPFTSVIIKGSHRGTICDYYGFFSIVVDQGDTLEFTSVGYSSAEYIMPDTLHEKRYSLIQKLRQDTIVLDESVVYPWPSREQFKEAFLALNAPEDDYDRAFKNLTNEEVRLAIQGVPLSGQANHKYNVNKEAARLYTLGQLPQISLLNPLAWAQFIEAWKRGDFKSDN